MALDDCIVRGSTSFHRFKEVEIEGETGVVWEERTTLQWTKDPKKLYGTGPSRKGEPPPVGYARRCSELGNEVREILLGAGDPKKGFERQYRLFGKGITQPFHNTPPMSLKKLGPFSMGQKVTVAGHAADKVFTLDGIHPQYDPEKKHVTFRIFLSHLPAGGMTAESIQVEGTAGQISAKIFDR